MVNVELLQYWLELVSVKPVFVTTQLQFITAQFCTVSITIQVTIDVIVYNSKNICCQLLYVVLLQ